MSHCVTYYLVWYSVGSADVNDLMAPGRRELVLCLEFPKVFCCTEQTVRRPVKRGNHFFQRETFLGGTWVFIAAVGVAGAEIPTGWNGYGGILSVFHESI